MQHNFSLDKLSILWSKGSLDIHESRGFFHISEKTFSSVSPAMIQRNLHGTSEEVILNADDSEGTLSYSVVSEHETLLSIQAPKEFSKIQISYPAQADESIYGCGTQLSKLNLKGCVLPILTREPGIGRGVQPLTFFMERMFGAGGEWHCTSAPSAWFLSTEGFGICVENEELVQFDFQNPTEHRIIVHSNQITIRFFFGDSPKNIVQRYTEFIGRFPSLPDWFHDGAIIGLQGGSAKVRKYLSALEKNQASVSAFWLQDWVGGRKTSIGKQLWWNWELDDEVYPDWDELREELHKKNIKLLSYINPFLVDSSEKGNAKRILLREAIENDYLIKNQNGEPYPIQNTSFFAYLIDLSNPKAQEWIKDVIKDQVLSTGVHGWMADFAEALPFDAVLHSGTTAEWHNRYPVEWAKVNREAIQEAGKEGDVVFFHRAAFTQSPRFSTLMWMGDQLADWGKEDGLHSAVIGLLSSGFSGFSINHGDIGGYIATTPPNIPFPIPGFAHRRSKELLMRWTECFSCTAVFRTHEGNQPKRHTQIDYDAETLAHFSKFSRLFAVLHPYRNQLFQEAAEKGFPVVRSFGFVYPELKEQRDCTTQFFLGDDILMAPVLHKNTNSVRCYVPDEGWILLWTNKEYSKGWHTITAPIGEPCILVKKNTKVQKILQAYVEEERS